MVASTTAQLLVSITRSKNEPRAYFENHTKNGMKREKWNAKTIRGLGILVSAYNYVYMKKPHLLVLFKYLGNSFTIIKMCQFH